MKLIIYRFFFLNHSLYGCKNMNSLQECAQIMCDVTSLPSNLICSLVVYFKNIINQLVPDEVILISFFKNVKII